jgi:hypothetical protein
MRFSPNSSRDHLKPDRAWTLQNTQENLSSICLNAAQLAYMSRPSVTNPNFWSKMKWGYPLQHTVAGRCDPETCFLMANTFALERCYFFGAPTVEIRTETSLSLNYLPVRINSVVVKNTVSSIYSFFRHVWKVWYTTRGTTTRGTTTRTTICHE